MTNSMTAVTPRRTRAARDSASSIAMQWHAEVLRDPSTISLVLRGEAKPVLKREVSVGDRWLGVASTLAAFAVILVAMLSGCSSLIDDPCAKGYELRGGNCVEKRDTDAGPQQDPPGLTIPHDPVPPFVGNPDAGPGAPDGGGPDGSTAPDGSTTPDGSTAPDGGPVVDAGPVDTGPVVDAGPVDTGPVVDAGPIDTAPTIDAPVCPGAEQMCGGNCVDLMTNPNSCGTCGHQCASGICELGHCLGELPGHIVAIGHDYRHHNVAMARVLGNAAALAARSDVGVAKLVGTAAGQAQSGTTSALAQAMSSIGRSFHDVALPPAGSPLAGIDVLIVEAQTGDGATAEATGAAMKSSIDALLAREGVVIVLEGRDGVGFRFAIGAGLYTFAAPIDATGAPAFISNASDAVTQQVVSPYLADTTSAVYVGVTGAIATPSGAVVVHMTR